MRIKLAVCTLVGFASCTSSEEIPPTYSDSHLANYFAPAQSIQHQLWLHSDLRPGKKDSLYYFEFIGQSSNKTFDGYSPISFYRLHDTSGGAETMWQMYVSDSAVISYGADAQKQNDRLVILGSTLAVGSTWIAADSLTAPDGKKVRMNASVENYYPNITAGDSVYYDAFRVIYTCSQSGAALTQDDAFTPGATHVSYFAKQIGKVLEYVYDPNGKELWKNELQRKIVK